MEVIDIKTLARLCKHEIEAGHGDKKIVISDDDEGNSYHGLYYGFENAAALFAGDFPPMCYEVDKDNIDEFVTLG